MADVKVALAVVSLLATLKQMAVLTWVGGESQDCNTSMESAASGKIHICVLLTRRKAPSFRESKFLNMLQGM